MKEIDEMDLPGFLRIRAWNAKRNKTAAKPKKNFIDKVWPGVRP